MPDELPAGFVWDDAPKEPSLPQGFSWDSPDHNGESTQKIPPSSLLGDWRTRAAQEIQRQNINPNLPSDLSQAKAIQNAYAQQYAGGPTMPQQLAQERLAGESVVGQGIRGFGQGIAAIGPGLVGLAAPKIGAQMQENVRGYYDADPNSISAKIGTVAGNLAPLAIPGAALVAPAAFGATAAGESRIATEQAREQGVDISGGQEFANAALHGVTAYLIGKFGTIPNLTSPAGKALLLAEREGIAAAVGRTLTTAGVQAGIGAGQKFTDNLIDRATGVSDRPLSEGIGEAAITQGIVGGAIHGVKETSGLLASMRANRGPELAQTPETEVKSQVQPEAAPQEGQVKPQEDLTQFPDTSKLQEKLNLANTVDEAKSAISEFAPKEPPAKAPYEGPERRTPPTEAIAPEDRAAADRIIAAKTDEEANAIAQEHLDKTAPLPEPGVIRDAAMQAIPPEKPLLKNMRKGAIAIPDISGLTEKAHVITQELGSWLGSDLGSSLKSKRVQNDLREVYGEKGRQAAIIENVARKYAGIKQTPDEVVRAMGEIERGQPLSDTRFEPLVEPFRDINNRAQGKMAARGVDVGNFQSDWVRRAFEFPDEKGRFPGDKGYEGEGQRGGLAGTEKFWKARKFENVEDAYAAVKAQGGRLKYNNVAQMLTHGAIEVSNSNVAHDQFQKWIDAGEVREQAQPGDKPILDPVRWTHQVEGKTFYASPEVADLINHQTSEKSSSPILNALIDVNRKATRVQMLLGLRHYLTEAGSAAAKGYGQASKDIFRGQFKMAAKEAAYATPGIGTAATLIKGMRLNPESPEAKVMASGGAHTGRAVSILDKGDWQKMKDAWDEGRGAEAAGHFLNQTIGQLSKTLFDRYIPNMRKGIDSIVAESEMANAQARGVDLNSPEFKDLMAKHALVTSNIMGVETKGGDIHFQNKVASQVGRLLFGFPNWVLGQVRAPLDAVAGLKPMFQGKNADPATYATLGAVVTKAIVGTAAYALMNGGKMPQSWNDISHIPTPWKDKDGKPFRISMPYEWETAEQVVMGDKSAKDAVVAKFSPLLRFAKEMATGKNFKGQATTDTWIDVAKSLEGTIQPFAISGLTRKELPGPMQVAGLSGFSPAARRYGRSEAENFAFDLRASKDQSGPRSAEEIAHSDTMRTLESEVRAKKPEAWKDAAQALKEGKIAARDFPTLAKSTGDTTPLQGILKSPEIKPREVMQIWAKMTPEERRQNRWVVLGRIGRSEDTFEWSVKDRIAAFKQISQDMKQ